jgi:hypothetical protein
MNQRRQKIECQPGACSMRVDLQPRMLDRQTWYTSFELGGHHVTLIKDYNQNLCNKLTSLQLVLRTTIMTPVKPQISKFKADKILPSGL